MSLQELTCIEVLLRNLVDHTDLEEEIDTEFHGNELSFKDTKIKLFNTLTINKLLANYYENPPFSLDLFLDTGIIQGIYPNKTLTPTVDPKYFNDSEGFVRDLVEALKEGNYLFSDPNNIFVSSEKIETTIPQIWLYRLAEGYKRKNYQRLFFFNKSREVDISDGLSLIEYLQRTKTFLVSLSSSTNDNYEDEYANASRLTNESVKGEDEVKVNDLISSFIANVSPEYSVAVSKYRLKDLFWITKKAEKMGNEFYSKSLEEQQEIISNWLIEYINSNERAITAAQTYILLTSSSDIDRDYKIEDSRNEIIVGLFNLYISLLESYSIDYDALSLTKFKIDKYMSEELLDNLSYNEIIRKRIEELKETNSINKKLFESTSQELVKLDLLEDKQAINLQKQTNEQAKKDYLSIERQIASFNNELNKIQANIRNGKEESIADISFDNNFLMSLIIKATKEGRVYTSSNGERLILELYNDELGKTYFKASIKITDLLVFLEDVNYSMRETLRMR